MKKIAVLFLAGLCAGTFLTGCGTLSKEDQVLADIMSANTTSILLEQFDNIMLHYDLPEDIAFDIYVDKETYLSTDEEHSYAILFSPEEQCEFGFMEDGTEYFHRYVNIFDEDLGAPTRDSVMAFPLYPKETITSLKEENGILLLEFSIGAEDLTPEDMEIMGIFLDEGDSYICSYEADAKSSRLLSCEEHILYADGTSETLGRVDITFNVERPAYIAELEARGDEIDALPEEQTRVIHFVIDPGLETERTVSQKTILGSLIVITMDMRGYALYLDAEGTQPYVQEPGQEYNSSVTLYLIKTE